ncbi:MAG: T9SS type A sorting domain-containing protein, partial [Bacteroidales bacterium]|nr:T9SS type A sorting domain-containing protein [Bacteroidales bacterium]
QCYKYTNIDGEGTLQFPVTFNGTTTTNLVDALNLWIAEQDHPELYRSWTMLTDTIPVFGSYYIGVPENPTTPNEVTVCPNPASERFVIQGVDAELTQVFNVFGQLVKTVQNTNEISAEGLSNGIYLLRIASSKGKTYSIRVVVEQ